MFSGFRLLRMAANYRDWRYSGKLYDGLFSPIPCILVFHA